MRLREIYDIARGNIESTDARFTLFKAGAVVGLSGAALAAMLAIGTEPLARERLDNSLNGPRGLNPFLAAQTPECASALLDPKYGELLYRRTDAILATGSCGTDKEVVSEKVTAMMGKTIFVNDNANNVAEQKTVELWGEAAAAVGALAIAGAAIRRQPVYMKAVAEKRKAERKAANRENWRLLFQQLKFEAQYSLQCRRHIPKRFLHDAPAEDSTADN